MANLRYRMYFMMKRVTDDFCYGIFDDPAPTTDDPQLVEPADRNGGAYENQPLAQTGDATALPLALFLLATLLSALGARYVTKGRRKRDPRS